MSRVATVCGLGGRLTVVCVDEMRCLRGVVDELDLANLPHLGAFVTELLQHTHAHAHTGVTLGFPTAWRAQPGLRRPLWESPQHITQYFMAISVIFNMKYFLLTQ